MRVISWNLAYWTPGRYKSHKNRRRQWSFIASLEPDIGLIQECRPEDLQRYGLDDEYSIVGEVPTDWTACSALFARKEMEPKAVLDSSSWRQFISGYLAVAALTIDGQSALIASVHTPADIPKSPIITESDHKALKRDTCEKAWYSDVTFGVLKPFTDDYGRFIIGGDWNECRKFDQLPEFEGGGEELFIRFKKSGWHESLRRFHPEEIQTFLKSGTRGFELDHLFTDAAFDSRLIRCDVLADTPISELSDHAIVIADFK